MSLTLSGQSSVQSQDLYYTLVLLVFYSHILADIYIHEYTLVIVLNIMLDFNSPKPVVIVL